MDRPGVSEAVANLIKCAAERRFAIGSYLTHDNADGTQTEYQLIRILQPGGWHRAYLANNDTGVMRNSRKVVSVQGAKDDYPGYVTELPAEKDCFVDPDDEYSYLNC